MPTNFASVHAYLEKAQAELTGADSTTQQLREAVGLLMDYEANKDIPNNIGELPESVASAHYSRARDIEDHANMQRYDKVINHLTRLHKNLNKPFKRVKRAAQEAAHKLQPSALFAVPCTKVSMLKL